MRSRLCKDNFATIQRQTWGRLFGGGIEEGRRLAGLSIEQAAEAVGMEASEWRAIEEGHVPEDPNKVFVMADAIHLREDQIALWTLICSGAWER